MDCTAWMGLDKEHWEVKTVKKGVWFGFIYLHGFGVKKGILHAMVI